MEICHQRGKWHHLYLEDKNTIKIIKPRQGEPTYARICIDSEDVRGSDGNNRTVDTGTEWSRANRRRRISSVPDRATKLNAPECSKVNRSQSKKRTQTRRRSEALVVKVDEDKKSIEAYRNIVGAKSAIQKATGVRKTRTGHILIELSNNTPANKVTEGLKSTITQETEIDRLLNRMTLEIKNIDSLITKEELSEDIHKEMNIQDIK